ncbi:MULTISPECIES: class I SAM-dependent methyltransferase [Nocardiopsis]|uniref:Class I SAM-dependent methyltransferase n=1 Tax=Nocardiopsis alba TaxID=53437 RepID=A0ABV5DUQ1_9ACTN|nr:class I SAM-dependent methyltransferase [Nocardiopsis sp. LDBS1602]MEC3894153.1 class I SAM-dependent methyltransferase [Nocardiopsis sp. LDBS1602]
MSDRTQAFAGLAENYRAHRPGYPDEILTTLRDHVLDGVGPDGVRLLVDVGSGTGISTRALRSLFGTGPRVIGVEPGDDMRAAAAAEGGEVEYLNARAEEIPLPDASASLVLTAQALHWFDRPAFYAEAARLLERGGSLAALANDRDLDSPFIDDHESLLERHSPGYDRHYRSYDLVGEFSAVPGLTSVVEHTRSWVRELTPEGYLGMAMSSSRVAAAVRAVGEERVRSELEAIVERNFPDGRVLMPYVTRLVLARRDRGATDGR